ncbi:MAG: hypothetical protein HY870_24950 [Chloroflexi bacterium]|nr:hypothetical protein [Chloroflexota bacterium]
MIRRSFVVIGIVSVLLLALFSVVYAQDAGPQAVDAPQAALGTAFTYQGQLKSGGAGVSGSCEMAFRLYDAATVGNPVGGPLTQTVAVNEGFFTAQLDFGASAFDGQARWLEITVKCASDAAFTTLSRQALTAAPYALALPGLRTEPNATSPNIIGGYSGNWITASVYAATVAGGGENTRANRVTDNGGTVSGGVGNQAGDNAGTTSDRTNATVAGGYSNFASGSTSTVGGGLNNGATNAGATVGGGSYNLASGIQSTVPGGRSNTAAGSYSLAAGRRAQANANGCFVWGDSTDADIACNTPNQFLVRATGGVSLTTSGAGLAVDGNTIWHAGNDGPASGLNADLLDGQHGSYYLDATNIQAGTLGTNYFSAYADLSDEGYLNNSASTDLLTRAQSDGRYWMLGGNAVAFDTVLGTTSNYALDISVNNQRALRLEPESVSPNIIGGHSYNYVTMFMHGATIGGGGTSSSPNEVTYNFGTVGGGYGNVAGHLATVGGGSDNLASKEKATVGGGMDNSATADLATVPGGSSAVADHYGQLAYASGGFGSVAGTAQASLYVMRYTTTSGTNGYVLQLDGINQILTIAVSRTLSFDILVVGRTEAGESAGYQIQGVIENVGGTTAFVGTPAVTVLGEDDAAWNATVVTDSTDALKVFVQGNNETIRWVATVRTSEVAW